MMAADGDPIVVISRSKGGWRDKFRAYDIFIDEKPHGKLKRGERVELPVPVGKHVVYMKIDWCRSDPVELEVTSGDVVELNCAPGSSGTNTENYIELTRA